MRLLKINGARLDIDDETAIGLTMQAYDFKNPGALRVNISNSFTIPCTSNNMRILGITGGVVNIGDNIYNKHEVTYSIKNTIYIQNGDARIESISKGRVALHVSDRPRFVDAMKEVSLGAFLHDWFLTKAVNPTFASFTNFINHYAGKITGVNLTLYLGNLSEVIDPLGWRAEYANDPILTVPHAITMESDFIIPGGGIATGQGGHFGVHVKDLFLFIVEKFAVNFNHQSHKAYNIFNDIEFARLYIPAQEIGMRFTNNSYSLKYNINANFFPLANIIPYKDKSVFDFFTATLQLLGYGLEHLQDGFELVRMDKMVEVYNDSDLLPGYFDGNFAHDMELLPNIPGYGVRNYIKMKPGKDVDENTGSKIAISRNMNAPSSKDLFTVDALMPFIMNVEGGEAVIILDDELSFNEITFMQGARSIPVEVRGSMRVTPDMSPRIRWSSRDISPVGTLHFKRENEKIITNLPLAAVYTVNNEYKFIDLILSSPHVIKARRWLTSYQVSKMRMIAIYYIQEFGGWYFINKISNFNPEKSLAAVEFELIHVPSDRIPEVDKREREHEDIWILSEGKWNDRGIWIDTEVWVD